MGGTDSMSWDPNGWGTSNPDTGDANSPIGRFFQGAFGKHGSTTAQLPQNLQWINGFTQNLAQGAPVDYSAPNAAQAAGTAGSNAAGLTSYGTLPGTASAWNTGLTGLGEGVATGFQPSMDSIDAVLRPGVERSFQTGAADIREQNALTGNLSSTGASQQIGDYRAQLENNLNNSIASIYGGTLPSSIDARTQLTQTGLQLPGYNTSNIYTPTSNTGLAGYQGILDAIRTAFGGISAAPYSANQGSGGNGAGSALLTKGMG